jgi:hypothetical protein
MWRSLPQIDAMVIRATNWSGAGSTTGYSRISIGIPEPRETAARPVTIETTSDSGIVAAPAAPPREISLGKADATLVLVEWGDFQ